jgi:hypothetical protein
LKLDGDHDDTFHGDRSPTLLRSQAMKQAMRIDRHRDKAKRRPKHRPKKQTGKNESGRRNELQATLTEAKQERYTESKILGASSSQT